MTGFGDDEITEILEFDPDRIDAVLSPANGTPFLLLKSVAAPSRAAAKAKAKFGANAGHRLSPEAREAFILNAQRVRQGKKPKRGKADKQRRGAGSVASKAALGMTYSQEVPATGCANESASILAAVTGESTGMCSARTANGLPCQRPAVNGRRCHLHA